MKFTKSHEWVLQDEDEVRVGITDYAQKELGEVVYVELPEVGAKLKAGEEAAVLESTKAAADVYAPVSGEVTQVNTSLKEAVQKVNHSAEGEGWLFKMHLSNPIELETLLDKEAYAKLMAE